MRQRNKIHYWKVDKIIREIWKCFSAQYPERDKVYNRLMQSNFMLETLSGASLEEITENYDKMMADIDLLKRIVFEEYQSWGVWRRCQRKSR